MRYAPLLVLGLTGCGTSPQPYGYPGCPDAGVCLMGGVFGCAQAHIAQRFNACQSDSDCTLIPSGRVPCGASSGVISCIEAVRADQAGAYRDELVNEAQRFCQSADQTQCMVAGEGCNADGFLQIAYCDHDAGRCAHTWNPDAGGPPNQ